MLTLLVCACCNPVFSHGVLFAVLVSPALLLSLSSFFLYSLREVACLFLPAECVLQAPARPFRFQVDPQRLARALAARAEKDERHLLAHAAKGSLDKCRKIFGYMLRALDFARQLVETGAIGDLTRANDHVLELRYSHHADLPALRAQFEPLHREYDAAFQLALDAANKKE